MKTVVLLALALAASFTVYSQEDNITTSDTTAYQQQEDSITSYKIRVGQYLIIGEGTGEHGWYKTIAFKSAFAYPLWLFRESEIKNNYTYTYDPAQYFENDQLKETLTPGQSLKVLKIKSKWDKVNGYWHQVYLKDTEFPRLKYWCNLEKAIKTGELLVDE